MKTVNAQPVSRPEVIVPFRKSRSNGSRPARAVNSASSCGNRGVPGNKRSRKGANSVPFPQRERIKQKFISGKNISQIAREEGRHWDTVSRIVKEEDVAEHVRHLRERFYGALEDMVAVIIRHAMTAKDGGWLAYEMLKDGGVIPGRGSAQVAESRPLEVTAEQDRVRKIAVALVEGAIERHKYFGLPLEEVDEVEQELVANGLLSQPRR